MATITIPLSDERWQLLKSLAESSGVSAEQFARVTLESCLDQFGTRGGSDTGTLRFAKDGAGIRKERKEV